MPNIPALPKRDIVVVGASAGGVEALISFFSALPVDLDAAILVVLHIPPYTPSRLDRVLGGVTTLPVVIARDGEPLERGRRNVHAGRLRLLAMDDRAGKSLDTFVSENVLPSSRITTDGRVGYNNLAALGYNHASVVLDGDMEKAEQALPMIHLVFSNLKAWLLGTHHGVSQQHLPAYLNEFVFRFNRRFYPMTAFATVLGIGMNVTGPTYRGLYDGQWDHHARPSTIDAL